MSTYLEKIMEEIKKLDISSLTKSEQQQILILKYELSNIFNQDRGIIKYEDIMACTIAYILLYTNGLSHGELQYNKFKINEMLIESNFDLSDNNINNIIYIIKPELKPKEDKKPKEDNIIYKVNIIESNITNSIESENIKPKSTYLEKALKEYEQIKGNSLSPEDQYTEAFFHYEMSKIFNQHISLGYDKMGKCAIAICLLSMNGLSVEDIIINDNIVKTMLIESNFSLTDDNLNNIIYKIKPELKPKDIIIEKEKEEDNINIPKSDIEENISLTESENIKPKVTAKPGLGLGGRNIEVKIKLTMDEYIETLRWVNINAIISEKEGYLLKQEDIFYNGINKENRLKTRNINNNIFQLISYNREDEDKPKLSSYNIANLKSFEDFEEMKIILEKNNNKIATIKKTRVLSFIKNDSLIARIHLDLVENLGHFMEIEVVLKENDSEEDGKIFANDILQKMSLNDKELIKGSYLDLSLNKM